MEREIFECINAASHYDIFIKIALFRNYGGFPLLLPEIGRI